MDVAIRRRDVQVVAPTLASGPQTSLPPWMEVAIVLEPDGDRLDLQLTGPGFGWHDEFDTLKGRGAVEVTTDDVSVYSPALQDTGPDGSRALCPDSAS